MSDNDTMADPSSTLNKRLQHLERTTTEQAAEGRATRADIEKLTKAFDNFSQDVSRWMQQSGRPNVGWLLGGASLIITIMTLAAAPFLRDLSRVEDKGLQIEARLNGVLGTRYSEDDHDVFAARLTQDLQKQEDRGIERVNAVRESLIDLQEKFAIHDRDVSALNAKQNGQIQANEERSKETSETLRLHMSNGHPHSVIDKLGALEKRLDALVEELSQRGKWMTETDVERAAADAEYAARLTDMEREVREISSEQRRRTGKVYDVD